MISAGQDPQGMFWGFETFSAASIPEKMESRGPDGGSEERGRPSLRATRASEPPCEEPADWAGGSLGCLGGTSGVTLLALEGGLERVPLGLVGVGGPSTGAPLPSVTRASGGPVSPPQQGHMQLSGGPGGQPLGSRGEGVGA